MAQTATILVTDLAGSTETRVQLGEARAEELRRAHDSLLTEQASAHGGHGRRSAVDQRHGPLSGERRLGRRGDRPGADRLRAGARGVWTSRGDCARHAGRHVGRRRDLRERRLLRHSGDRGVSPLRARRPRPDPRRRARTAARTRPLRAGADTVRADVAQGSARTG